jgi:hypothetical protein
MSSDHPTRLALQSVLAYGISDRCLGDIPEFVPEDPSHFAVRLQVFVSDVPDGAPDSFDVTVCSPKWLVDNLGHFESQSPGAERVVMGHELWLQERWDAAAIRRTIETLVASVSGQDWGDLANWLGRSIPWEYAYKYDREHGVVVDIDRLYPQFRRDDSAI